MTNILVECPQKIASVKVGVLEPLRPLEQAGLCKVRYLDTVQITRADIAWCDVLVCVRGSEYATLRIVEAAKAAGRFLVYFLDDDLLNIPDGCVSTQYYRDERIRANLTKILGLCDVLWAINAQIVQRYKQWCPRTALMRVSAEVLCRPPVPSSPIHVLYAGSIDHSGIAREILSPVVIQILSEYAGRMDFTFIGVDPGLRDIDGVVWRPFFESYDEYRETVMNGGYSVGLAPVYELPFYACKYYNKFIEYSSFGIAGIYSDCELYRQIVRSGENGVLCKNTFDGWYCALKQFLDHPQTAARMAQTAEQLLESDFSGQDVARSLREQIPEIVAFRAKEIAPAKVGLPPAKILFYQERFLLTCRMYGLRAIYMVPLKAVKKLRKAIRKRLRGK